MLLVPHDVPARGRLSASGPPAARSLAGAGALFRDADGRVLLVKPTYKPPWELPGGVVEEGESPRQCAEREVAEELGFEVVTGRLLVIDWLPVLGTNRDRLLFVFDGGVLTDDHTERIALPERELSEWRWVEPQVLGDHLGPGMVRRVRAALVHAGSGTTGYTEFGWPDRLPLPAD